MLWMEGLLGVEDKEASMLWMEDFVGVEDKDRG